MSRPQRTARSRLQPNVQRLRRKQVLIRVQMFMIAAPTGTLPRARSQHLLARAVVVFRKCQPNENFQPGLEIVWRSRFMKRLGHLHGAESTTLVVNTQDSVKLTVSSTESP